MARGMFSFALVSVPEVEPVIGVFENSFVFFASVIGFLLFYVLYCVVLFFLLCDAWSGKARERNIGRRERYP